MPVFLEFLVGAIIIWILVTQVIIPAYKGARMFPMFSKERRRIDEENEQIREERELRELKQKQQKEGEEK